MPPVRSVDVMRLHRSDNVRSGIAIPCFAKSIAKLLAIKSLSDGAAIGMSIHAVRATNFKAGI
jgi:hypothetical protein